MQVVDQVRKFLGRMNLKVIDWNELSASLGGSAFVGDVVEKGLREAQAVVVLFTADEFCTLDDALFLAADKPHDRKRWQARPNVLFEAGMAFGVDKRRTILVTIGTEVSLFSDVEGRNIIRLDNSENSRNSLRLRLSAAGCTLDDQVILTGGEDFESGLRIVRTPRDPARRRHKYFLLELLAFATVAATAGFILFSLVNS